MKRFRIPAVFLAMACIVLSLAALADDRAAELTEHMEVEATDTCDGCHAEITPEIHQEWFDSKHGVLNVKCFVCHGAIGEDFMFKPSPDRCVGCHFEQVESLATPFMEGKNCFSCHPPHELSPHSASSDQGGSQ